MQRAVLLVNLGSPASPDVSDVQRYLHQFLMDRRVIDVPYLLRKFIVCCQILPTRPKQTAEAYRKIWTDEGSPLQVISERVRRRLQESLSLPVALGMRYGEPSIAHGIRALAQQQVEEIFVLPLYPHYAMSSYETAEQEVCRQHRRLRIAARLSFFPPFYNHPAYIAALVESARPYLQTDFDHLLLSYHGIPERHLLKTDPTRSHCLLRPDCCETLSPAHERCYRAQVFQTTKAVAAALGIPEEKYSIAFQSRLGRDPWLRPYTDHVIPHLAKNGVKRLIVICPSFVADCLETLEEIGIRGREAFLDAGGEELRLIPCLNDHPGWIGALSEWCQQGGG